MVSKGARTLLRPGPLRPARVARLACGGTQLPLLRARSARSGAFHPEPYRASLPLGGDGRLRPPRPLPGRRRAGCPLAAIGISLGGNVLLKWLGENPGQPHLAAAATISVPYDLEAGARKLERGLGPVYTATFLRGLRKKARLLLHRHPEAASRFDVAKLRSARTFFEFDDAVTGPLHGFRGAEHYYDTSSP